MTFDDDFFRRADEFENQQDEDGRFMRRTKRWVIFGIVAYAVVIGGIVGVAIWAVIKLVQHFT